MTKPSPILFVHHSNDLYGADIMLLETVSGLDKSRYTPIVVLPEDCRSQGGLAAELDKIGIRYRFLPLGVMRRKYFRLKCLPRFILEFASAITGIVRIIRKEHIVVVHSNTLAVCSGAVAARLTGTPHVWHIHEMLASPVSVRILLHFLATRQSASVICVSEAVKNHVLQDQPAFAAKLIVVPNGLTLEKFATPSSGERFRFEFGVPRDAPFVGMIGRINQGKGQALFAQAAKLVLEDFPEAYFIAVGSFFADERHHLEALLSEVERRGLTGRFMISDFRRDIAEVLAALDVYVQPSLHPEAFGLVVLEAMAAGKAVIAAAHGGPLEMIEDGISGYLVPPGSPSALADRIKCCLRDRAASQRMGKSARERAFQMFHVRRYLEKIQAIYDEVIA